MSNILDYIKWRGDITLGESCFNEIDNLILSRFSYFPFDDLIKENEMLTIKELSNRFKKHDIKKMRILWKEDVDLFPLMGDSKRYGEMYASDFVNIIDKKLEKQFAAITIIMPNDTIYVSFRGTDATIVGWKEDFNMSFKSHIESQISAKEYLNKISAKYSNKNIIVGGHSKGGNEAIYASAYSNKEVKDRILNVYNNDGPGFCKDVIESEEYKNILNKVHTYIPQSSIIGRLMNHEEKITILESTQKGIMQHDLYSWQVLGTEFVKSNELTNSSEFIDQTLTKWLEEIEPKKREQVIDVIFEILYTTDADTFKDIKMNWFENTKIMMKCYKNLDIETKNMVTQTVTSLIKITKNNMFEKLPKISDKLDKSKRNI